MCTSSTCRVIVPLYKLISVSRRFRTSNWAITPLALVAFCLIGAFGSALAQDPSASQEKSGYTVAVAGVVFDGVRS